MGRAFIASLLFHLTILGAMLVGLPHVGEPLPPESAITVEIVSELPPTKPAPAPPKPQLAEAAPLPQRQAAAPAPPPPPPPAPKAEPPPAPKPAPPPPPPAPPKPVEPPRPEPAPTPVPKKPEEPVPPRPPEKPKPVPEKPAPPKPEPVKPEPPKAKEERTKPVEVAKAETKKDTPPKPPAAKSEPSDFDALLRSVEAQAKRVKAPEKREGKGPSAEAGGTNQPGEAQTAQINPSALVSAISRQVTPCWNIPVGAQGITGLRAELNIVMGPDGSVQSVVPMDATKMSADPVYRAFAESAVRAVRACSPLQLPSESYQVWKNIIFNFDPSMLTG